MSTTETTKTGVVQALKESEYFSQLSDDELSALAQITHAASYDAGEMIFHQGDDARNFYIVIEGQIQVYKISDEGKEMILHIFGKGDIFAEIPVFDGWKSYPAYALCLKPTRVLAIEGEGFKRLVSNQPEILLNVLKRFARRIREFGRLIEDVALHDVDSRLYNYLLSIKETSSGKAQLRIPKKTLAAVLGTVPQTLSRSLKKLSEQGVISIEGNEINIL